MLLKLMYKQKESHDFQIHYFLGFKSFLPVQNNQPVTDKSKNIRDKALPIATCKSSTLYTVIPHNKSTKNVLKELISFCFEGGKETVYCCSKALTIWIYMD